jgi:glycosyltransferase involved in cell wall biosynthesis
MGSKDIGGLGEIPPMQLASFSAPYRLFFNPIRYTSMGLAVCEAMTLGMPIVGLATTEMATVIENGVSGYVDTSPGRVIDFAAYLLSDPSEARRLGEGARRRALQRFGINRFVSDWEAAFRLVTAGAGTRAPAVAASEVGSI